MFTYRFWLQHKNTYNKKKSSLSAIQLTYKKKDSDKRIYNDEEEDDRVTSHTINGREREYMSIELLISDIR